MEQREDKKDEESEGEEDGVCPPGSTLRHLHEVEIKVERKPKSPTTAESEAESGYSGLSFRSDWPKDYDIINFKSGQLSAGKCQGLTRSSSEDKVSDVLRSLIEDKPKCPGLTPSLKELLHHSRSLKDKQNDQQ